ncbi:MAG: hypothetical protein KJO16_07895 [Muriicola sp.]|nr:hypothetical protein [Muriicola sp.]
MNYRLLVSLLFLFYFKVTTAQLVKERSLDIAVGLGLSAPYDDVDVTGTGFYLQGEYVLTLASWIELRPYAGVIFAKTRFRDDEPPGPRFRSDSNGALLGGKARLTAPIPWVAPFVEGGIGASIGSFETFAPATDLQASGLIYHIPFSLGLALGPDNNVDIAFTYYFHPTVRQFAGAAAFGLSIPLQ